MAEKRILASELKDGDIVFAPFGRSAVLSHVEHKPNSPFVYFRTELGRDRMDKYSEVVIEVPEDMPITLTPEDYQRMQRYLGEIMDHARRLRRIVSEAGTESEIDITDSGDAWEHVSVIAGNLADVNNTFFGRGGPIS